MSTKIYTGFRIQGIEFSALHQKVMAFQAKAIPVAELILAQTLAKLFSYRVDDLSIRGETPNDDTWWDTLQDVMERQRQISITNRRDPEVDFSFELSFIPQNRSVLGIYYTEVNELAKLWMGTNRVKEYHYQNSTDRPSNIKKRTWTKRYMNWNEALGYSRVSERSFSTIVIPIEFCLEKNALQQAIKYIPTLDQRLKRIAINQLIDKRVKQSAKGKANTRLMKVAMDTIQWVNSDQGKPELIRTMEQIKPDLIENISPLWKPARD